MTQDEGSAKSPRARFFEEALTGPPTDQQSPNAPAFPTATTIVAESVTDYQTLPGNAAYGATAIMYVGTTPEATSPCYGTIQPGTVFLYPGTGLPNPPAFHGALTLNCFPNRDPLSTMSGTLHSQLCDAVGLAT